MSVPQDTIVDRARYKIPILVPVLPSVTRMVPQNPATKQASKQSAHPFYVAIEVYVRKEKKTEQEKPIKIENETKQKRKSEGLVV